MLEQRSEGNFNDPDRCCHQGAAELTWRAAMPLCHDAGEPEVYSSWDSPMPDISPEPTCTPWRTKPTCRPSHRASRSWGAVAQARRPASPACRPGPRLNVDAHYRRAASADVEILDVPRDQPFGDRIYLARDIEGHEWYFAQHTRDVSIEELSRALRG